MNLKFGKWISTNDLYLVTLKELVEKNLDVKTWKTNYIMLKKCKYTICKKKQNSYYDVFTNIKYEPIYKVEQGNYGISDISPLIYQQKFISKEELANKLNDIKVQADKIENYNKPKVKKIIPFPKKY